jgi:putative ABC transport system permease protein
MEFYLNSLALGLALTAMCWGIFITLRIFNFPDITTDGSYTLGAAITASAIMSDWHPLFAMSLGVLGGIIAGITTGIINTKFKVNPLLAGILVMTALYSFNLAIMGRSNIPLLRKASIFNLNAEPYANVHFTLVIYGLIVLFIGGGLLFLLLTDYGIAMRATGNNEKMVSSLGGNTKKLKIAGLAIANGLTALSGSLVAQLQGFADINMGIGIVIFGLGAAMIGETITQLFKGKNMLARLLGVLVGCILFRMIIAYALASGVDPNWLKAITALIVLIFVSLPLKSTKAISE